MSYKKLSKIAKIRARDALILRIAFSDPLFCQFIQQPDKI